MNANNTFLNFKRTIITKCYKQRNENNLCTKYHNQYNSTVTVPYKHHRYNRTYILMFHNARDLKGITTLDIDVI